MDSKKIMIVEDDPIIQAEMENQLKKLGHKIACCVTDAENAVLKAAEHNPELVLMDIMFNGQMSGISAADQIRESFDIPVIYITAHADEDTIQKAFLTAPLGYLIKPVNSKELKIAIEFALYKHGVERQLKEKEKQLTRSRDFFLKILDDFPYLVFVLDPHGNNLYYNKTWLEFTGRTLPDELEGESLKGIYLEDVDRVKKQFAEAFETRQTFASEFRYLRYDREYRTVQMFASPFYDVNNSFIGLIAAGQDVTDQRSLQLKLLESQKMQAIGTLAGGIAHNFNNMLAIISGYCQLIKMEIQQDHPFYESFFAINKTTERAAELTKQLLTFARVNRHVHEIASLNALVSKVVQLAKGTFDPSIQINTHLEENLYRVDVDINQLEHTILNLCLNARDAMPEGGELILSTQNVISDEEGADILPHIGTKKCVLLQISDTGQGIPEALQKRVFEPFFTTKPEGKGTGLGLSVVYSTVKNHGGNIYFTSQDGLGTTFYIYLPAALSQKAQRDPVPQINHPRGTETILVIDDEPYILKLTGQILTKLGYKILTSESGAKALEIYMKHPVIDLVILDLILPEMDGKEVLRRLVAINPQIKVIGISGSNAAELLEELKDKGLALFLQKPFNISDLTLCIRKILDT